MKSKVLIEKYIPKNRFYVYTYLNPEKPGVFKYTIDNVEVKFDFEPFYIGKGTGRRATTHLHKSENNNLLKYSLVQKLLDKNQEPILIFLDTNLSEKVSLKIETKYIDAIGRINKNSGPLTNKFRKGTVVKNHNRDRKVIQFDINGNFISEWSSAQIAEEVLDNRGIVECVTKITNTSNQCFWFYKDEFEYVPQKLDSHLVNQLTVINNDSSKRKVLQFSMDEKFIKEWESIQMAANYLNIDRSQISKNCSEQFKSAGGFIWKHKDKIEINTYKKTSSPNPKKINQINKHGEVVKTWNSITEASNNLQASVSQIHGACSGYRNAKTAKGYYWEYFKDGDIEINLDQPIKNKNCKKINQFSLNGVFIKTWESIVDIVKTLNIKSSCISDVCVNRKCGSKISKTAGGFIWKYYIENQTPILKDAEIKFANSMTIKISVIQLDINGNFIKEWPSMSEAAKHTTATRGAIGNVCQKKPKYYTAGGFKWEYAETYYASLNKR